MSTESASTKLSFSTKILLAIVCGIVYFYAFKLNAYWFDRLEFSYGTNWVFIPSGLRLLFVLVLIRTGAIGIMMGSMAVNYSIGDPDAHVFNVITSLISGGSPYIARHVAVTWLKLDTELSNLNARAFFKISILFAAVNGIAHQLWFFWDGQTQDFVTSSLAMAVGDWLGTVLVLAAVSLAIKTQRPKRTTEL